MRYSFIALLVIALIPALQAGAQEPTAGRDNAGKGMGMLGQKMDMSDDMKQRCRMMMQTAFDPSDPAAILSLKDDLKLTPEQAQKVQAIADKARREASAVLNEQQLQILEAVPAAPNTPMAMHQHMMRQMHGGNPGGDGQMPMMNCPMINMMGAGQGGATTQPAPDKADDSHKAHH